MLSVTAATRIFVALEPVDMRQGFNGLFARVQGILKEDPTSGHFFVFTNKNRNRLKILCYDGSGLWVCAKRLDRGTFGWPQGHTQSLPYADAIARHETAWPVIGKSSYANEGVTWAVVDFLERFFGVRWYWPGEANGRSIVKTDTLVVAPVHYRDAPVFRCRTHWPPHGRGYRAQGR